MDRNREGRRTTSMAAPPNGLSSSRRRHRSSSGVRDSPDEEGTVDVQEAGRLRDRGVVKKDRGDRDRGDRERDRERERSSRSKRRRESRMMIQSNRDDGDDTSDESVNDEIDDDEDAGNGGAMRMLPPPPSNPATTAAAVTSNHHSHNNHNPYSQQIHHRKSLPSSGGNKVFRGSPAAPVPAWKAADEMIGVTVPRKARSASTKRSHEWISGGSVVGGGTDQSSASPVRLASSAASPAQAAPPSPSSSNVSVRKKMKSNGGGSKPRPPKSSSKSSSSNPEELEIEIAEVLYGLMTQSQAPSKKEIPSADSNKSLSAVAPKNTFSVRNSPVSSSIKSETDHNHHHHQQQSPKTDISSPSDNGVSSIGLHRAEPPSVPLPLPWVEEEGRCGVGGMLTKEEVEKESPAARLNGGNNNTETVITTAASTTATDLKSGNLESQIQEEKFEIDLMAPPPQLKTSQESDGNIHLSNHMPSSEAMKTIEPVILTEEQKKSKAVSIQETGESSKQALREENNLSLHIDFEKPNKDSSNRSLHQALKHQQLSTKSETHTEKTAQPSSFPVPMSMANWPPMGYVAPLQGVISMDGNTMPSAPIQPLFTHPRPKRCATHCYIARNIHYLQQLVKMNPFWSPASGPAAPMFAPKHNGMPSSELHASIPQSMQDKGQPVGVFPGHTTGKDTKSSHTTAVSDPTLRKQQVLLQQAMPSVTPNNILHGPAFIFPFNQQQAVAASASVRPGSSKASNSTVAGGSAAASGAANSVNLSSSTTAAAAPALCFNYPNMSANETQYLAIVQNHPYAFPMPAVGGPPNYRGNHPHPQPMPLFNGSFYSSQMIHPSQIPQPPQQAPPPAQSQQTLQNSSGSTSSSQKHLQAQQRQQGSGAAANGSNSYPAAPKNRSQHMNPPAQSLVLENEVTGREDSPSTADSRGSRAAMNTMNVHGHNFAMPVHSQNFALMKPQQAGIGNSNDKKQQQQSQQQVLKRVGVDSSSSLPPQTFAMSFAPPMNGATGQNHAIFQSLQHHHMMTSPAVAASIRHSEQKDFRVSDEAAKTTGHDSSNTDEDRKGSSAGLTAKSGQSIAFSRPDLATDASGSSPAAAAANNRSTRSSMSTSVAGAAQSSHHLHGQFQQQQQQQQNQHQQQFLQLQKQQQQHVNARSKNPEHLITSSSTMASMFPNNLSSYPLQTSTTSGSPVQSPQWRSSVRGPTSSQVSSSLPSTTTSSLKNLHPSHQAQQQQSSRPHQQSHTQISFGSQKLQSTALAQMMMLPPQQQQQQQQQNSSSTNQSPSPPMLVGSPTNSSLSSSQPSKNALAGTQRSSPSILGNPHNSTSSTKSQQQHQQQINKQTLQQQQQNQYTNMMFRHPYMQVQQAQAQAQQHSVGSMAGAGYYLPRKQQQSTSSTAMLSLSPPVTLASTTTSDPAKAIAAATSNLKGGQGILHAASYGGGAAAAIPAGFPQYVHNNPAGATPAVQVKPAEQKQPAGE